MKFLSSLLLACALCGTASAYFVEHHIDYQKDINVLRNLDISSNYIKDLNFVKTKISESKAYKKHLLKAINEQYDNIVILQNILKEQNVPTEILYLAVIESGLKNNSKSRMGAAGIWQFMPRTAKAMGLRVDSKVDERLDPLKSTKAAAKYLSELKEQFGKWYLALIAYNCGDGALRKAIARAGSDDIKDLLDPNKKFVGLETRNFLRKIIITAQIANDLNQIMGSDPRLFNNPNDINIAKINVKDAFKNSAIQKIKSAKK